MRVSDYSSLVHAQDGFSSTGSPGDPFYYKYLRGRFPFVIFPFREINSNLKLTKTVGSLLSWSMQLSEGLFGSRKIIIDSLFSIATCVWSDYYIEYFDLLLCMPRTFFVFKRIILFSPCLFVVCYQNCSILPQPKKSVFLGITSSETRIGFIVHVSGRSSGKCLRR